MKMYFITEPKSTVRGNSGGELGSDMSSNLGEHSDSKIKLYLITRKYPPMVGGMEKVSYALIKELSKKTTLIPLTWGGSQKYLPLVLPYFLFKALIEIPSKRITHIHLGDALLAPLGYLLKIIFRIKCTVTVHGLDITFKFKPYQYLIPLLVSKLDKVICVSEATMDECIKRGIPEEKCVVIPNGVYVEDFQIKADRKDLEIFVKEKLDGKKVIVTVGRLVKRKGVFWFIKNVFINLPKNYTYLVVGDGPDKSKINNLIFAKRLSKRIKVLGKISDNDLKVIYNTADLMVLPNQKVKGDIEGFGIVAIEASAAGLPVIASDIEGLKDAVINGKNGYLVSPKPKSFIKTLNNKIMLSRVDIKKYVSTKYSWNVVSNNYFKQLETI